MNRDIILIGNGPSALEHEMGAVVDSFHTVVRFNWFHIKGFEKHVGQKTDIWFTTIFCPDRIDWYPYRAIYEHSWDWNPQTDTHYQQLKAIYPDVIKTSKSIIAELKAFTKNDQYSNYSTGAIATYLFLKTYPQVTLYGFDWWENYRDHHYGDKQKIGQIHHPDQEFLFFSKLAKQGKVLTIDPHSKLNRSTVARGTRARLKDQFEQKWSRLSPRKHPFERKHRLKRWFVPEKLNGLKSFFSSDFALDQIKMMKLLCLCARPTGHPEMYTKLTKQAATINSWEKLPDMAEQHGLAPLVYYHLREAKVEIPAEINRTLKGAYLTHRHANRERMAALKEIAAIYRDAGIEMLALKGAALANTIYPDIALRCMCDLDLLVANDQADKARKTLRTVGFNIHETATIQPKAFSHHFPPATRDRDGVGVMVELHHHLYAISKLVPSVTLDKLLPDAISFDLDQTTVDTLSPEQMLWHAYIHAVGKLQLVEQFRLIHVADLIGLVETYADCIDWQRLEKTSPQTYHAIMMLHLFSPWSADVTHCLPFETTTSFNFNDFPHLPTAMGVSSRNRGLWIPRFFKDIIMPPDWWVCFFQGNHPVKFNFYHYRISYPLRRIGSFAGNLFGFYVRKGYRKWR